MKRLISVILTAVMLMSVLSVSAFAKGELLFSDSFDQGFIARNWITNGNKFTWNKKDQCITGYSDAVVVESAYGTKNNKWWDKFYASVDFKIHDFDDVEGPASAPVHTVSLWYNDLFERAELAKDSSLKGANYMYTVEIETGKVYLHKSYEFRYQDEYGVYQNKSVEANIAEGQLEELVEIGADAPWYNIGIRVTEGKIECYFNEKLVLSSSVEDGTEKYGDTYMDSVDATVGSEKSAIILWNCLPGNTGNYMSFDNFEVWSADYDFVDVIYGDVDNSGAVDLNDVTKMLQAIAKWELSDYNEAAADVDASGSVDLGDVTHMLKYIAKWEGITLG